VVGRSGSGKGRGRRKTSWRKAINCGPVYANQLTSGKNLKWYLNPCTCVFYQHRYGSVLIWSCPRDYPHYLLELHNWTAWDQPVLNKFWLDYRVMCTEGMALTLNIDPDDFTCQWESAVTQWVKHHYTHNSKYWWCQFVQIAHIWQVSRYDMN
jgi:hypothetical protein